MPTQREQQATQVDNFGTDQSQLIFEDELSIAENIGGQFIERVKTNIEDAGMVTTGRIDDITIQRTTEGFDIMANNYLIYQDKGVNGARLKLYDTPFSFKTRRPPVDAIREWVSAKSIGDESDAFAIAEKIFQEGFPPKNIFSREVPQLADDVANATGNLVVHSFLNGYPFQ